MLVEGLRMYVQIELINCSNNFEFLLFIGLLIEFECWVETKKKWLTLQQWIYRQYSSMQEFQTNLHQRRVQFPTERYNSMIKREVETRLARTPTTK